MRVFGDRIGEDLHRLPAYIFAILKRTKKHLPRKASSLSSWVKGKGSWSVTQGSANRPHPENRIEHGPRVSYQRNGRTAGGLGVRYDQERSALAGMRMTDYYP